MDTKPVCYKNLQQHLSAKFERGPGYTFLHWVKHLATQKK